MRWRETKLDERTIAQASTIKSVLNLTQAQAEAAVIVAGLVEQIAREERVYEGQAIELLDQEYQGTGLYRGRDIPLRRIRQKLLNHGNPLRRVFLCPPGGPINPKGIAHAI